MNNTIDKYLIQLFCFLGPIGTLIPLFNNINSFRLFYVILIVGVVYFFYKSSENKNAIRKIICYLPIILLLGMSAIYSQLIYISSEDIGNNSIVRFFLLLNLFLFTVFIGNKIRKVSYEEKIKCILIYLTGYFISCICGYVFFIGFYAGFFSLDFINNFQVLTQRAYGLLRFSPGSYPNEYGIVSSYSLSIITLLLLNKNAIKIKNIYANRVFLTCFFFLALIALFLTTTRAAYIAYIFTVLYLCFDRKNIKKTVIRFIKIILIIGGIMYLVQNYIYDIFSIINIAFSSLIDGDTTSSAYARIYSIEDSYQAFLDNIFLGIGFGRAIIYNIHNVYIQLVFELGLIGMLFLGMYFLVVVYKLMILFKNNNEEILKDIAIIGLIHVLWFATNNHNLNHHLTWFVFFSLYMLDYKKYI